MQTYTLTLSKVEQAAVLRHLQLQHDRLATDNGDRVRIKTVLDAITKTRTVALDRVHYIVMLRFCRQQVMALTTDMMHLEERRLRGGYNGTIDAAHAALDADVTILEDVIRRLWQIIL